MHWNGLEKDLRWIMGVAVLGGDALEWFEEGFKTENGSGSP